MIFEIFNHILEFLCFLDHYNSAGFGVIETLSVYKCNYEYVTTLGVMYYISPLATNDIELECYSIVFLQIIN